MAKLKKIFTEGIRYVESNIIIPRVSLFAVGFGLLITALLMTSSLAHSKEICIEVPNDPKPPDQELIFDWESPTEIYENLSGDKVYSQRFSMTYSHYGVAIASTLDVYSEANRYKMVVSRAPGSMIPAEGQEHCTSLDRPFSRINMLMYPGYDVNTIANVCWIRLNQTYYLNFTVATPGAKKNCGAVGEGWDCKVKIINTAPMVLR